MLKGFKQFLLRGNVVDMAVGIVIGAAFGGVVTGFVKDLLTPLIAAIVKQPHCHAHFLIHPRAHGNLGLRVFHRNCRCSRCPALRVIGIARRGTNTQIDFRRMSNEHTFSGCPGHFERNDQLVAMLDHSHIGCAHGKVQGGRENVSNHCTTCEKQKDIDGRSEPNNHTAGER